MYKCRLQELCQQRSWEFPSYAVSGEGPDHKRRFKASVTVNGVSFCAIRFCTSSKEAQNEAASIAFNHFSEIDRQCPATGDCVSSPPSSSPSASPIPDISQFASAEMRVWSKSDLHSYARRRNMDLPVYEHVIDGPPHSLRFKARVTVAGQTFEGSEFLRTLKAAENAAAEIALASLTQGTHNVELGHCKNILQQLCQKEGFGIPDYVTDSIGSSQKPSFSSTVRVDGEVFKGAPANSKKQAEINAAKLAWTELKARVASRPLESLVQEVQKNFECVSVGSNQNVTAIFDKKLGCKVDTVVKENSGIAMIQPVNGVPDSGFLAKSASRTNCTSEGDVAASTEMRVWSRSCLQSSAQKGTLDFPVYEHVCDAPLHVTCSEASAVAGPVFGSSESESLTMVQTVENAAPENASASLRQGTHKEVSLSYKNQLQHLCQKEGFEFPNYVTGISGPSHMPTFSSTVSVDGKAFKGTPANSKKQAETNAAKLAWTDLKARVDARLPASLVREIRETFKCPSIGFGLNVTYDLDKKMEPKENIGEKINSGFAKEQIVDGMQECGFHAKSSPNENLDIFMRTGFAQKQIVDGMQECGFQAESSNGNLDISMRTCKGCQEFGCSKNMAVHQDAFSATSNDQPLTAECSIVNPKATFDARNGSSSRRIVVYPRKSDLNPPEGAYQLPFQHHTWVAFELWSPNGA